MDSLQSASAAKLRRLLLGMLLTTLFVGLAFLAKGQERVSRDALAERAAEAKLPSEKSGILTSRPPAAQTPMEAVKIGDEIVTAAGQRRRLQLPDGSILFVNEQTEAKLTEAGPLSIKAGEVYVESAPAKAPVVLTPHGEVNGKASHFNVRVNTADTQVLVARGILQYKGGDVQVIAGQRLSLGKQISFRTSPVCLSQMLDWTRELMLAAESPLVPGSEHAGGALIAVDPKGQEAKLELRKFHVDVFIEDGFARTTIDQTYFNHEAEQLEGTFYFPLPPDASLSRLAMYVGGQLREGGMAERDLARQTYESFRYYNRDPALLEWVDGSTFKMRVFPIEARQEKRLVLSYSQRLPNLNGEMQYRFPAGHSLQTVKNWSFKAQIKDGKDFAWSSSSHKLERTLAQKNPPREGVHLLKSRVFQFPVHVDKSKAAKIKEIKLYMRDGPAESPWKRVDTVGPDATTIRCEVPHDGEFSFQLVTVDLLDNPSIADLNRVAPAMTILVDKAADDLVLAASAKNARTDKDVVLSLSEPKAKEARFSSTMHDGAQYFMARFRPDLQVGAKPQAERRDWVFLFEASGDRDPLLARVQIDVIRHLLHHISAEDRFTVLTANTRVKAWSKELQPASTENVLSALAFLEGAHLIGALDLGQALSEAGKVLKQADNAYLVHLGSGVAAMGERRHDDLLRPVLSVSSKYVGVGIGRRWDRSFMKAAAERSGGHFTQINPDEQIPWRSFELFAGLNMPRLQDLAVTGLPFSAQFLTLSQSVSQGEEVCAVAKIKGDKLPEKLVITGKLDGKPWTKTVEVKDVTKKADYLPRTWAKLEIDRLLTEDAAKNKDTIVALSKSMYVMTPFTSLLVLENDDQHVQFKIDFGRKDHWATYACPPKIDIVYEPLEGMPDPKSAAGKKPTAKQVLRTVVIPAVEEMLDKAVDRFIENERGVLVNSQQLSPFLADPSARDRLRNAMRESMEPLKGALPDNYNQYLGSVADNVNFGGQIRLLSDVAERLRIAPTSTQMLALPVAQTARPIGTPAPQIITFGEQAGVNVFTGGTVELGAPAQRWQVEAMGFGNLARGRSPQLELGKASLIRSNLFEMDDAKAFRGAGQEFRIESARGNLAEMLPTTGYIGRDANSSLLYRRPTVALPASIFFDLTSYAPGMANSTADVKAVLEAEARPTLATKPGKIDAQARDLFTKARSFGWQSWTLPAENGQPQVTIVFEGSGKYAYERLLHGVGETSGIRELVTCDGQTLQHLYPLLGIGAQRSVSRFHRAELADVVPWTLPDAADLARGADLKVVAERIVAVVSHQEPAWSKLIADSKKAEKKEDELYWLRIHLVFGEDGKLSERQVVKMPKGHIVSRRVSGPDGVVKLFDAKGKEVSVLKGKLSPAQSPNLVADTKDLVVLPLPYRTAEHVLKSMKDGNTDNLRFKEALPLFAAHVAAGNGNEANRVFRQVFYAREQRQLGFYVLLASCGLNLDSQNGDVLAEHLENPVAQYLALHSSPVLRKHASQWAMNSDQWQDGFLQHLGQTHAILQSWESPKVLRGDPAKVAVEKRRAIEYVKKHKDTAFAWALLCNMQDRADKEKGQNDFQLALAECWDLFKETPGLQYAARYERARSLHQAGKTEEARKSFRELYEATLKEDRLPPIDDEFRRCMQSNTADDPWSQLVTRTAEYLIEKKNRPAVLALARQVWRVEDQPLAQNLLTTALAGKVDGDKETKERLGLTLAVIEFLTENGQVPQADELLKKLLAEPKLVERSDLWRLAATLADRRDMPARGIECLEKALDLEYRRRLPGGKEQQVVDLEQVRADYRKLLNQYQSLADAMVALKLPPPEGFLAKVVRSADRWRALDIDSGTACQLTANVLRRLGESELGWDYLTTPIGMRPNEADPWWELAGTLGRKGELKLADRAYQAAFEAEPTNAQILWDRAQNLRQAGEEEASLRLYRQLAEGTWQPRFQGLQTQARSRLKGS